MFAMRKNLIVPLLVVLMTTPIMFFLLLMSILFLLNHLDALEIIVVPGDTLSDPS